MVATAWFQVRADYNCGATNLSRTTNIVSDSALLRVSLEYAGGGAGEASYRNWHSIVLGKQIRSQSKDGERNNELYYAKSEEASWRRHLCISKHRDCRLRLRLRRDLSLRFGSSDSHLVYPKAGGEIYFFFG